MAVVLPLHTEEDTPHPNILTLTPSRIHTPMEVQHTTILTGTRTTTTIQLRFRLGLAMITALV